MNRADEIVDLAEHLVRQRGYAAFSYADLSAGLHITTASLHYHFPHKVDLAMAVCDRIDVQMRSMAVKLRSANPSPLGALRQFIELRAADLAPAEICPISALQSDLDTLDEVLVERVRQLSELEVDIVESLLGEASAAGEIKLSASSHVAAGVLLAAVKGALQYGRVLGREHRDTVIAQLLHNPDSL